MRSSPRSTHNSLIREHRSRVTGHPVRGRHPSQHSPKCRNRSRDRIVANKRLRTSKENDLYIRRPSPSTDRNPRKYDEDTRKPAYRGPENINSLKAALSGPSRIVVVRKMVSPKQSGIGSNRTMPDGNEGRNDLDKDGSRFVYIQIPGRGESGPSVKTNDREKSPLTNEYERRTRRDNRRSGSVDYDRSERSKKHETKHRSIRPDKPYPDDERRSRKSTRESSDDHRDYDKYKYEGERRHSREIERNDSDHQYHHPNREEKYYHKNEQFLDNPQNSYENEQNEQSCSTNEGTTHLSGGLMVPGTVRPVHFENTSIMRRIPGPVTLPMPRLNMMRYFRPVGPMLPTSRFPLLLRPPYRPLICRAFPYPPPGFYPPPIPQ